jgi:hypothetical protein
MCDYKLLSTVNTGSETESSENFGGFGFEFGEGGFFVVDFFLDAVGLVGHHVAFEQHGHLFLYYVLLVLQVFLQLHLLSFLAVLPHLFGVYQVGLLVLNGVFG